MAKRLVAVFTGNRAEYGLQLPILRAIEAHDDLDYQLIVSGAHLDSNFGSTLDEIRNDGFHIDYEVKIKLEGDSNLATANAIGNGIVSISDALENLKPDIVVVYADRFEGFAAVIAATQMNIPTAHIEGGDITEGGALDDSVRHAMTKLSHLHFTTHQQATNRILAMGEESWRVHTVGLPTIDLISEGDYATPIEISEKLGVNFNEPLVVFTQHSITTEFEKADEQIQPSIDALKELAAEGVQVIMTYPNNDAGGRTIIKTLDSLRNNPNRGIQVHKSLGRHLYHGILSLAKNPDIRITCVGNSSSGMKETAIFGCPTVNIGSRQQGRLRGENVIDVGYNRTSIIDAVTKCLYDDEFRELCSKTGNPYYLGDAGQKIVDVLATIPLGNTLIRKGMTLSGQAKNGWYR